MAIEDALQIQDDDLRPIEDDLYGDWFRIDKY